jgi:acylphosphatase
MKLQAKILGSKVHEVGYRVFLLHKAIELGCRRFSAYNRFEQEFQMVVALIEGDEGQLNGFRSFVDESRPEVSEVSCTLFEEYHGYVMSVEDFMHASMVEQLNKGTPALLRIDRKQDKMLEKQDRMQIGEQKEKLDDRLRRIESDISKLKAKVGI